MKIVTTITPDLQWTGGSAQLALKCRPACIPPAHPLVPRRHLCSTPFWRRGVSAAVGVCYHVVAPVHALPWGRGRRGGRSRCTFSGESERSDRCRGEGAGARRGRRCPQDGGAAGQAGGGGAPAAGQGLLHLPVPAVPGDGGGRGGARGRGGRPAGGAAGCPRGAARPHQGARPPAAAAAPAQVGSLPLLPRPASSRTPCSAGHSGC